MNYADYAFPANNYLNSKAAEKILDDWLDKVGALFPADYVSAMLKTVHGVVRLKRLSNWLEKTSTDLEITIQTTALTDDAGNPVHGTTRARGSDSFDPNAIETIISTFPNLPDRMQGWSADEIINIVGVHESFHIRQHGKRIETLDCPTLFAKCHFIVIQEEFKARIEYSLVDSDHSVSKSSWLDIYQRYFDTCWRLEKILTDPTYKNTSYCDELDKTLMKDFELYHEQVAARAKSKKSTPPSRRESLSSFEGTAEFASYLQNRRLKDYFVEGIKLTEILFYEAIDESYRFNQVFKLYTAPELKKTIESIFSKKAEYSLENLK
jgi:hypothetical protein